jgi:hypothetical protein
MRKPHELTGKRFGLWAVLRRVDPQHNAKRKNTVWQCRCSCGTIRTLDGTQLTSGRSGSCGCVRKNAVLAAHAAGLKPKSRSKTYGVWRSMLRRCYELDHQAFSDYGGRGITVCPRWRESFENFLTDMGEAPAGLTLDRYPNNDGNYEPCNCRWATPRQQANNRRSNRRVQFRGESMTVAQWADRQGITVQAMCARLKRWPLERALVSGKTPSH